MSPLQLCNITQLQYWMANFEMLVVVSYHFELCKCYLEKRVKQIRPCAILSV